MRRKVFIYSSETTSGTSEDSEVCDGRGERKTEGRRGQENDEEIKEVRSAIISRSSQL